MDKKSAFSLVELMVAVGIVGVLVTLALPRYQQFMVQARRGEAKSNLSHIATLQETYKVDHYSYYSGAAMSGTNGVGYKDGLGNPGNCSDPSDDRDEGINNHLGFRPNGCGQLRYFYQLRNSGNTAVASAASDAKGRHIYPDCSGGGAAECGYVSGDAVRLAMSSGKSEVCRNITNYCPGSSTTLTPPPCPLNDEQNDCTSAGGTWAGTTCTCGTGSWSYTGPPVCSGSCSTIPPPICPPNTCCDSSGNPITACPLLGQTLQPHPQCCTTTPPTCPPGESMMGSYCCDISKQTAYNNCTGTWESTCMCTPPPTCPPGEVEVGGQCCSDTYVVAWARHQMCDVFGGSWTRACTCCNDACCDPVTGAVQPNKSDMGGFCCPNTDSMNFGRCTSATNTVWTGCGSCECNATKVSDAICQTTNGPNFIAGSYPNCQCVCDSTRASEAICTPLRKEFDPISCTCEEPIETCNDGDYTSGLVSAARSLCDSAQGSFRSAHFTVLTPDDVGKNTCHCDKTCTASSQHGAGGAVDDAQSSCPANKVFTADNTSLPLGQFDCTCDEHCASLDGTTYANPLSVSWVDNYCRGQHKLIDKAAAGSPGEFYCTCEPACTSGYGVGTPPSPVSVTVAEDSCLSDVANNTNVAGDFFNNIGGPITPVGSFCSGSNSNNQIPYRFSRDSHGVCTCTSPIKRNAHCVGGALDSLVKNRVLTTAQHSGAREELAACYKGCQSGDLDVRKQCYADAINRATTAHGGLPYSGRECEAMEFFNSHRYITEGSAAGRDCGQVENELDGLKMAASLGTIPGVHCINDPQFIFIQAP